MQLPIYPYLFCHRVILPRKRFTQLYGKGRGVVCVCDACDVITAQCRTIFKNERFPAGTKIVGYARSALTVDNLKEKCKPFLKVSFCTLRDAKTEVCPL